MMSALCWPTVVAMAGSWRLQLLKSTVSPSTMVISPTPPRQINSAAKEPTPPKPITMTCFWAKVSKFSRPNMASVRESHASGSIFSDII